MAKARHITAGGTGATHPYPYIVACGQRLGSFAPYIHDQVEDAKASNAPRNAYAKKQETSEVHGGLLPWDGKSWHTTDDLPATVKTDLEIMVTRMGQRT